MPTISDGFASHLLSIFPKGKLFYIELLIIIDLPEEERSEVANSAFELLAPNGIIIVQEPEVPTGDVGVSEDGQELTPAQKKVDSFNKWIKLVKYVHDDHSIGFTEVSGGTLAVLIKKE